VLWLPARPTSTAAHYRILRTTIHQSHLSAFSRVKSLSTRTHQRTMPSTHNSAGKRTLHNTMFLSRILETAFYTHSSSNLRSYYMLGAEATCPERPTTQTYLWAPHTRNMMQLIISQIYAWKFEPCLPLFFIPLGSPITHIGIAFIRHDFQIPSTMTPHDFYC